MASVDGKYHVKDRSQRHLTASVTAQSARREGEPGGRGAGAAQASVAAAVPHAPAAARARQRAQLDARHLRVRAEAADVVLGLIDSLIRKYVSNLLRTKISNRNV